MNSRPLNYVFLAVLALLAASAPGGASAQRGSVRGVVVDGETGDLLFGATVSLDDLGGQVRRVTSGSQGLFSFSRVNPGRYALSVSFVGFETWADTVDVTFADDTYVRIEMAAQATEMKEIVVETVRNDPGRFVAGMATIQPSDLARIPMPDVTYDLAGYLQSLPGFVSAGDRGGQLFVRGGTPTQNLVLLDGIPLYQPFHIVGFYSAVPAEIISYTDVYAGGFGAQYGGRISSVIDITTRNANKRRFQAAGSVAPFLSGLRVELPVAEDDVSLLLSIRESVIERVAPDLLGRELPFQFGDLFGKLHAYLTPTASVSLTGLRTHDEGNILAKRSSDELGVQWSTWNNQAYGANYLYLPPDYPAMFEFGAYYTSMDSRFRLTEDEYRSSEAESFGLRMRFHYLLGDTQFHFGIFGNLNRFNYKLSPQSHFDLAAVSSGGAFIDTRFLYADHVRIEPGIRIESFSHGLRMALGPRLRLIILPEGRQSRHQLSGAWGKYHQQIIGLNNEQDVSDVFTIWAASPQYTPVPEATHLIAGYRGRFFAWLELTVEAYKKWLKNLAFPVFSEAVEGKTNFSQVTGDAEGVDMKLDVDVPSLYFSVGYSLASVTYLGSSNFGRTILIPGVETTPRIDSEEFFPPHDRRHQINAVLQFERGANRFSVRWQFGSGLPFTQVNGYYNYLSPGSLTSPAALDAQGRLYVSRSTLYGERLPTYHRLDISYERVFTFDHVRATLQAGVINLYDRNNIFSYNIFTGDRVDQFPLIPSVGLKVEVN